MRDTERQRPPPPSWTHTPSAWRRQGRGREAGRGYRGAARRFGAAAGLRTLKRPDAGHGRKNQQAQRGAQQTAARARRTQEALTAAMLSLHRPTTVLNVFAGTGTADRKRKLPAELILALKREQRKRRSKPLRRTGAGDRQIEETWARRRPPRRA